MAIYGKGSELRYRLDPHVLIERARRLEAERPVPALPDVAALCLRIRHHARALGVLEESSNALLDWATSRYEAWAASLHDSDLDVIKATLASDPINLLLGGLCLPSAGVRERVVAAYLTFAQRFHNHGLSVVSHENEPLAGALFRAMGRWKEVRCLPSSSGRLPVLGVDIHGIARYALSASEFGSRLVDVSERRLIEPVVEAHLVKSARTCDLLSAGSSLLAATLLGMARERSQELAAWLVRMFRSDGLIGYLEFYEGIETRANLLICANAYWGLHAACTPEALYPTLTRVRETVGPPRQAAKLDPPILDIDLNRCERVGHSLCRWLDERLPRFRLLPACKNRADFDDRFKPAVEMLLVLFILTGPEHIELGSPFVSWARRMTEKLEDHLDWEGLVESFRMHATDSIGLMSHVLLEQLTGRRSRFHDEVVEFLRHPLAQAKERTPMRQLEFHMVRYLHGQACARADMKKELSRTLLGRACDPMFFSNEDAYDITHAVIYALALGRMSDLDILAPYRPWLRRHLAALTLASMLDGDFDLGGEFLICWALGQQEPDPRFALSVELLLGAVQEDGSVSGPPREIGEDMEAFERCYHTTQVCLVALAEVWIAQQRLKGVRNMVSGGPGPGCGLLYRPALVGGAVDPPRPPSSVYSCCGLARIPAQAMSSLMATMYSGGMKHITTQTPMQP